MSTPTVGLGQWPAAMPSAPETIVLSQIAQAERLVQEALAIRNRLENMASRLMGAWPSDTKVGGPTPQPEGLINQLGQYLYALEGVQEEIRHLLSRLESL